MKMAKASQNDLEIGLAITSVIESCDRGVMPADLCDDSDDYEDFDRCDPDQCFEVLNHILDIAGKGSLARVTWGMFIICDETNKILDPNVDHLALHPDLSDAGQMRKERDELLAAIKQIKSDLMRHRLYGQDSGLMHAIVQAEGDAEEAITKAEG